MKIKPLYVFIFLAWSIGLSTYSYSIGYNYGQDDAFVKARIQIYGK